jgi:hypothetical protein
VNITANREHIRIFDAVNDMHSIAGLHWTLGHTQALGHLEINDLLRLDMGVNLQSKHYLAIRTDEPIGPPYQDVAESGLPAGILVGVGVWWCC